MNQHILGDRALLAMIRLMGRPFFKDSVETGAFAEHLGATSLELPPLDLDGAFCAVDVAGLAGPMQAGVKVLRFTKPNAPLLIYHQGGGEIPFDRMVRAAYPPDVDAETNVIAVKTPFQTTLAELREKFVDFNNYVAMIAAVVRLTEGLIQMPDLSAAKCKVVAGYSLGGFVTGRHHLSYNSADAYVPFVSGTAHAEIFFTTVKAAKLARKNPDLLRSRLNFTEEWEEADNSNVFPVLARYDQVNQLRIQGPSYCGTPYEVWEGGHVFGAKYPHLIREKIERVISMLSGAGDVPGARQRRG